MPRITLIFGIAAAALVHAGLAFSDQLFPSRGRTATADADAPPTIAIMPLPVLEPEPPDPSEAPLNPTEAAPDLADLAPPPMQADVPSLVLSDTAIVQKLQPPPPPRVDGLASSITIPKGNFAPQAGKGLQNLFDINSLDQKPVVRLATKPVYPYEMRRARIGGVVVVGLIVDAEGNVRDPHIVSSNNPAFDAEALRAVQRWKFQPGRKGGVNVSTRNVRVPIEFNLPAAGNT